MRMDRQDHPVAPGEVAVHPLDLIGEDVRGRHLDGGGQVDDDLGVDRRHPDVHHRLAHLQSVVQLGTGKAFRRVLQLDIAALQHAQPVLDHVGAIDGDLLHPRLIFLEHHAALQFRCRVVQMDDHVLGAGHTLEGALDQMLPALGQNLDGDVVGDMAALDQLADKVEVGVGGRWEADLDLLEAHTDQGVEHPHFAGAIHRVDQSLIAVPQIHGTPDRRLVDHRVRPGAVGQSDGGIGAVFSGRPGTGSGGLIGGGHCGHMSFPRLRAPWLFALRCISRLSLRNGVMVFATARNTPICGYARGTTRLGNVEFGDVSGAAEHGGV